MPIMTDIKPYLEIVPAILSISALGFVIALYNATRNAAQSQIDKWKTISDTIKTNSDIQIRTIEREAAAIRSTSDSQLKLLEQELKGVRSELVQTEKQADRDKQRLAEEKNALAQENERLQKRLKEEIDKSGISPIDFALGINLQTFSDQFQESIAKLVERMEEIETRGHGTESPQWHLQLARAYMTQRQWRQAAEQFDNYVQDQPADYEAQFSRGVAYANSHLGKAGNLQALRAYNEAITHLPETFDRNRKGRMFIYRAAMLKRLDRLDQAESDLDLAEEYVDRPYETADLHYNRACIYAMSGNREKLMSAVRQLGNNHPQLRAIRNHLKDYFSSYADDKEFLSLTGNPR